MDKYERLFIKRYHKVYRVICLQWFMHLRRRRSKLLCTCRSFRSSVHQS